MSSDSSDASSASSPSPSDTSDHQTHHEPPTLEHLVSLFVSSKRALSSTSSVWRANELVTASRALLEEIAVINAKTVFARGGVDEQVDTLHAIRDGISNAADASGDEFRATIDKLDLANERLEKTLNELRDTIVDPYLSRKPRQQPSISQSQADEDDENESEDENAAVKALYHFIDETRHEDLRSSLRKHIDSFNDARADLDESLQRLDRSLETITSTINSTSPGSPTKTSSDPIDKPSLYDDPSLSIPELFHAMEAHAAEMATLLQSLVSHYDLSVTALKHTEGGGEAAARALAAAQIPTHTSGAEDSLYGTPAAPTQRPATTTTSTSMDAAERAELLRVLENDALEVEDAVGEMGERASALEAHWGQLERRARRARAGHRALRHALEMLREMRSVALPAHLHALDTFRGSWHVNRLGIAAKTDELIALCDFNDAFLADYAKLLREVERRRAAERAVARVADKAAREIRRLDALDHDAREDFMLEVGRYLPADLWPAINDPPVRWEVRPLVSSPGE